MMKNLLRAGAMALALLPGGALGQSQNGVPQDPPQGFVSPQMTYCKDATTGGTVACRTNVPPALPSNGAKETGGNLDAAVTKLNAILLALQATLAVSGSVAVSNLPTTQAISATSLPLPGGAASAAKQDALVNALGSPAQAPSAAPSIPALGTVTATAVTSTSGTTPTFASGTATIPFTPTIGLPIRIILKGGATFSAYVGTSANACASVNPLTVGGQPWATFTGSADEYVDTPVTTIASAGLTYCLVATVTSGTLTYGVRQ